MYNDYKEHYTPAQTFKHNLQIKLKDYVKDFSKIYIIDDALLIEFYHLGQLSITYVETNINSKLLSGLTSKELADKIDKWYKSIILSRHFVTQK